MFQVRYTCPAVPERLTLALPMLKEMAPGHRHLARLFSAGRRTRRCWIARTQPGRRGAAPRTAGRLAWSMLKLGIEHILTGADHLVFLLGLILVAGGWRPLLGVVTAFTVAHSITLALAALSIFAPSPRLVEPAIALSIAYVGVENLFVPTRASAGASRSRSAWSTGSASPARCARSRCPATQIPIALRVVQRRRRARAAGRAWRSRCR